MNIFRNLKCRNTAEVDEPRVPPGILHSTQSPTIYGGNANSKPLLKGATFEDGLPLSVKQRRSTLSSMPAKNLANGQRKFLHGDDKRKSNTRSSSDPSVTERQFVPQEQSYRAPAKNPIIGARQSSYHPTEVNEKNPSYNKTMNLESIPASSHCTRRASTGNIKTPPKQGLLPAGTRSQRQGLNIRDKSIQLLHNISKDFTPGKMPPHLEKSVIARLKEIALEKGKEGNWQESYSILKKVLEFQEPNLGREHPEVADTMHCVGVALNKLGCVEDALTQLNESLYLKQKLFGKNHMDVAATHHIIGSIYGNVRGFDSAIYHLKHAREIEIKNLGHEVKFTAEMLRKFEQASTNGYMRRSSV